RLSRRHGDRAEEDCRADHHPDHHREALFAGRHWLRASRLLRGISYIRTRGKSTSQGSALSAIRRKPRIRLGHHGDRIAPPLAADDLSVTLPPRHRGLRGFGSSILIGSADVVAADLRI